METKISNLVKVTVLILILLSIMVFSPSPSYAQLGDIDLSHGITHEDVIELQGKLKSLGFYKQDINSYFGKTTEYAVRMFQLKQGLANTGIFDKNTYDKLLEVKEKEAILKFSQTLKYSSKGHEVKVLQEALKALEYLQIENTSDFFGDKTREALISFQKDLGLKADGIADEETIESLNRILNANAVVINIKAPATNAKIQAPPPPSANGGPIASIAMQYKGYRYSAGGASPSGFDCSGFTMFVYGQAGISIPRTSTGQANVGSMVSRENLQPGDILIFSNTYTGGISHSGIYLGGGQFIHAANARKGVEINTINSGYWAKHFSYGRRVK